VRKIVELEKQKKCFMQNDFNMSFASKNLPQSRDCSPSKANKPIVSLIRNEISSKRGLKAKPFTVAMLGPGELFGDYEVFKNIAKYEFNLVCRSLKGEVLELDKAEFAKKIAIIPDAVSK
jgi:CRP-like cAMP-binding protein